MDDLIDAKTGEALCWKDCKTLYGALERYGITDTGPVGDEQLYILNDDATSKKKSHIVSNIRNRLKNNPEKKYLIIFMMAGHGMIESGK